MEAKPALAFTAALAIGAAAGYVAGHRTHTSVPDAGSRPGTQLARAAIGTNLPAGAGATDGTAAAKSDRQDGARAPFTGDWAADLAAAVALPSSTARADRLRDLADVAPIADVVRILEVAEAVVPGEALGLFGERLLARLARTDPAKALAIAERQRGNGREFEYSWRSAILESWIDHDVAGAVRWYQSLTSGTARDRSQHLVATILGRRAPNQGLALIRAMTQVGERREFASQFFNEWAGLDPRNALQAANEFFKLPRDSFELGRLVGAWARRDAAGATAHLRSLGDGPSQARLARVFLNSLAETSPSLAADLLPRFPGALRHGETVASITTQWAGQDLQAALRWAEGLDNPDTRRVAIRAALEWAANEDPKAALELYQRHQDDPSLAHAAARSFASDPQAGLRWIATLPTQAARDNAFNGFIQEWAQQDPKAAAQHVTTLPPGELRNAALNAVGLQLSQAQPEAVLEWVRSLANPQERVTVATQLAWQLAQRDPEQGVALVESLPKGPARAQAMAQLAGNWAENDLDGAVAWMKSQKDPAARKAVLSNLVGPWASSEPAVAAAYLASLPASDVDPIAWANVASQWAGKNPKEALSWLQSLPEGEASQQAMQAAVTNWAERSPAEALAFAQSLSNPELRQQTVEATFQSWSTSDPVGAAAALEKIPDPAARASSANQVVSQWAAKDPAAAAAWLAQQPEAVRTDEVVQSLSSQLVQFEPQTALQWAATIQNTDARAAAIEQAARQWFQTVPDDASKWLDSSGLAPEVVARIKSDGDAPSDGMPGVRDFRFHNQFDVLRRRYNLRFGP